MNLKTYLISGILAVTLLACSKTDPKVGELKGELLDTVVTLPTPTPEHILKDYQLTWNDEFDGTELNLLKWNYRGVGTVRKLATVSKESVKLDGKGNLQIKVTKDSEGKYYVGQVSTDGLYLTKYGYFECRAKMNQSIGPHVAFWLQSNTMGIENNDPQKNGVEIDIFEYHRKKPTRVFHNLHWNGYGDAHMTVGTNIELPNIGAGYHTFGLEWKENLYIFYVDGKETWRTSTAVSQTDQYMILTTELTGFGGDPELGTFPDAVEFDYVRVYKKK